MGDAVKCDGAIYVTKDDQVFGFGENGTGFLGTGDTEPRTEHTKIEQLCGQNIQELEFSNYTFFAISATGSVYAWGRNGNGQLGLGTKQDTLFPTKIEGILATKRVVQVACSDYHTLVLTSDREVFSFGRNYFGQLGLGHSDDQILPMKLDFPAAGRVVTTIACLIYSSVALLDSGEVLAWGENEDGILGHNGDVEEQNIPRKVPGLEGITITKIVCGTNHALALSNDGKVYSWGWNKYGQLGNGTVKNSHEPTLISGIVCRYIKKDKHQ
ncbi:RCC1 and BTB domain-containing protein 1-like [Cloeon dipterum]|uniref:RCC1 and BTB domain-containing protein 1-like n=1 Tax=Cloeon dipterum TaxID=197152 RepID=UPI00321F98D2